jgi:hypothetical protein
MSEWFGRSIPSVWYSLGPVFLVACDSLLVSLRAQDYNGSPRSA